MSAAAKLVWSSAVLPISLWVRLYYFTTQIWYNESFHLLLETNHGSREKEKKKINVNKDVSHCHCIRSYYNALGAASFCHRATLWTRLWTVVRKITFYLCALQLLESTSCDTKYIYHKWSGYIMYNVEVISPTSVMLTNCDFVFLLALVLQHFTEKQKWTETIHRCQLSIHLSIFPPQTASVSSNCL